MELVDDSKDVEELMGLPPEKILLNTGMAFRLLEKKRSNERRSLEKDQSRTPRSRERAEISDLRSPLAWFNNA